MNRLKLSRKRIQQCSLASLVLSILLFAGCAGTPLVKTAPREQCFVPTAELRATEVPPLQDETYGQIRREADQLRQALIECNRTKQDALRLLTLQNQQRSTVGETK